MDAKVVQILIAMSAYMAVVIGIGIFFAKRANENSDNYFLGGRSLGPWVTAMSAEASDMSGWLLMGLPGVAYWSGLCDPFWTAAGLAAGTYINWLLVARRLRSYSITAGNAITIPDFFSNRYRENKKILRSVAALFILVFFTVYAASCFVTCGKLFSSLFGMGYRPMMMIGAVFVIVYTFLGGFLAESTSDFIQGVIMIFALIALLVTAVVTAGGPEAILQNLQKFPGFLSFFGVARPQMSDGVQAAAGGVPLFGNAGGYGFLAVVSTMSWGLGYFGMPQVLLRFMAIRKASELKKSRHIAITWCLFSLAAALAIGVTGRVLYPTALQTASQAENIFIILSSNLLPPLIAGVVMSGILAATMSSSDSYLLIAASAFSKDLYQGLMKKQADEKQIMRMSRFSLLAVSLAGVLLALDENSVIFSLVAFAWAGFGAAFGPVMLFSLFWKRTTHSGAVAGMISGGVSVFVWRLAVKPLGGVFGIYELLPAFVISCIFILVFSLISQKPSEAVLEDFEKAKTAQS